MSSSQGQTVPRLVLHFLGAGDRECGPAMVKMSEERNAPRFQREPSHLTSVERPLEPAFLNKNELLSTTEMAMTKRCASRSIMFSLTLAIVSIPLKELDY